MILAGVLSLLRLGYSIAQTKSEKSLARFITNDGAPSFITHNDGQIASSNDAAKRAFGDMEKRTLAAILADRMGNPGPTLFRLQSRA